MSIYEWEARVTTNTAFPGTTVIADPAYFRFRRELSREEVGSRMRGWFTASLPCLACGVPLRNVFEAENQPSGGVSFASSGNYGSAVFDPEWDMQGAMKHIEINLCDACFTRAVREKRVLLLENHVRTSVQATIYLDA